MAQKGDNLNKETKDNGDDKDEKMPSDADERSAHPTDRGWAWMILLGSWVNMFFLGGMYKTSGILFIEFQKKYSSSSSMTSLAISLLNFGYSLSTIFTTSVLLSRISVRQCVMIGSVLVCLVYIVSAFAPTIEVLVFSFGLFLGLEYLRSALGFQIMTQTTFNALMIPLIGLIRDSTGSYNLGFHVMGTMMIVGGLWLLTVPMVIKFEKKRQHKKDIEINAQL